MKPKYGLTIQVLRPGQVNNSVADLSFLTQLAEVVPEALKVRPLLQGKYKQSGTRTGTYTQVLQ